MWRLNAVFFSLRPDVDFSKRFGSSWEISSPDLQLYRLFSTCGRVDLWFEFGVLLFTVMALMWSERSYAAEADVWKHLGRSLRFVLLEFWRIEAGNDSLRHISLWV